MSGKNGRRAPMRLHRLLRNRSIGIARRVLAPLSAWRAKREPTVIPLASVSRRFELVVAAMYGRHLTIGTDAAPQTGDTRSTSDIVLPAALGMVANGADPAARYRLLAIEQAARLVRGTVAVAVSDDPLEQDLYALAEGASIDRAIVRQAPGLANELREMRGAELARRRTAHELRPAEREVESLVRTLLAADPARGTEIVADTATPAESAAWARAEAARIRARDVLTAEYRGVAPFRLWRLAAPSANELQRLPSATLPLGLRRSNSSSPTSSEQEQQSQDEGGSSAASAGTEGAAALATSAVSDSPSAQPAGTGSVSSTSTALPAPGGIPYREWDEYAGRYRPDEVSIRASVAQEGNEEWAVNALRVHAPLLRQIRARFAPLRAHRARLRAQRSGEELDLDACVEALVDMRRGHVPSDRLYRITQPARRTLAIMLLVDVSGSTNATLADGRTVMEVERLTLLLASEALDELGDPYAVLAFSSSGRHDVQVDTVKAFAEHDTDAVRRRIGALASSRNTRLGAALRHATALLNAQRADRRLLLLLSDGQPNDVGGYQGSYAVGDSRRAVLEARASGVHPFCLTVDREEQEYLPHLFGDSGYRVLRDPAQLPAVLLHAVTRMLPG